MLKYELIRTKYEDKNYSNVDSSDICPDKIDKNCS